MTSPAAVLDNDTFTEDQTDEPTMCESDFCYERLGKPTHEADYAALLPCTCSFSYCICQERVDMFAKQDYVVCGCGTRVAVESVIVWPLR